MNFPSLLLLSSLCFLGTNAQAAIERLTPEQFETTVLIYANALSNKSENPTEVAEIKEFIVIQLKDEWKTIKERNLTVEQTFNGRTLIEQLVQTYSGLPPAQQTSLSGELVSDLRQILGATPPSAPVPPTPQRRKENDDWLNDWLGWSYDDNPNPSPPPSDNGPNNRKALWEKANQLVDTMATETTPEEEVETEESEYWPKD